MNLIDGQIKYFGDGDYSKAKEELKLFITCVH